MCLGTHQHIAWRLYKILRTSHQITLLVSDDVYDAIEQRVGITEHTHCLIKAKQESLYSYLRRVHKENHKIPDFVVNVGMYHSYSIGYLLHYIFNTDSRLLVYINRANSWMGPLPRYNTSVRLRTIVKKNIEALAQRIALSRFDGILVELPTIESYIRSELGYTKTPVRTFQPTYLLGANEGQHCDFTRFVIPGSVTSIRRDYDTIVEILHDLTNKHSSKFQITFLGRVKDDRFINKFESLISKGCKLQYYPTNQWIPPEEFEKQMSSSDVVLLPQKYKKSELFNGIYGRTGGTGGVSEAIMHAKPIILPNHFPNVEWIETSTIWYNGRTDLHQIMRSIIEDSEWFRELKEEAKINSQAFKLDDQSAKFTKLLHELH